MNELQLEGGLPPDGVWLSKTDSSSPTRSRAMLNSDALEAAVQAAMHRYDDASAPTRCESWRAHMQEIVSDAVAAFLTASMPEDVKELAKELEQEAERLSGRSIDFGSADSGIASNLASAAVAALASLSAKVEEQARQVAERDRIIAEKDKALEFYADISKYPAPLTGGMGALWSDCGQIARAALGRKA